MNCYKGEHLKLIGYTSAQNQRHKRLLPLYEMPETIWQARPGEISLRLPLTLQSDLVKGDPWIGTPEIARPCYMVSHDFTEIGWRSNAPGWVRLWGWTLEESKWER